MLQEENKCVSCQNKKYKENKIEKNCQIIMDDFAVHLTTTDTKKKLSVGQDIIEFLSQPDNSVDCEDLGAFIDGLVPWMQSSNFKVSPAGFIFKCCDGNGILFRK